jgi:CRP-like cAMP-binding protein
VPTGDVVLQPILTFESPFAGSARAMDFPSRATIVDEGEPAIAIYRIVSGQVMISRLLPDGRRQIFEVLGPGGVFGVTPNGHHDSAAEALTEVRIMAFDRTVADRSSQFNAGLASLLKTQLCALHDHAVLLGRKSAVERVATYILDLIAGQANENAAQPVATIRVLMTRSEIADYLGLTLETVSRAFSQLKRDGVIAYHRPDGPMTVDLKGLKRLTGADV